MTARPGEGTVPSLHVITDDRILGRRDFVHVAEAVLRAGAERIALHVRGPDTSAATLLRLTEALLRSARDHGSWLVVNDRVDVALVTGSHGVQLGARSLPPAVARAVLGLGARVGVSVHTLEEVGAAAGADWIMVGTIYETPSHPGRGGAGPERVAAAVARAGGTPVLAIGGVTPGRVGEVLAAGGHGVAVIRGIWEHRNPAASVGEYLEVLQSRPKGAS